MDIIITPRMVRDTLAFKGPMSLTELCQALSLEAKEYSNLVQCALLDLAAGGDASYDYSSGAWSTDTVLV